MRRSGSAAPPEVYAAINSIGRTAVLINPGSDRPQGPWDPNEKKKWIDTTYFWTLMPILLMMVIGIAVGVYFGD